MLGHFDLSLRDAGRLRDADFDAAIRAGALREILRDLPEAARARTNNLVMDNFAATMFLHLFSGPDVTYPYNAGGAANGALSMVCLLSDETEPTYTEGWDDYQSSMQSVTASVAADAAKRFVEDVAETTLIARDSLDREAVFARSRWLYLPSQAVSASIASLGVFFSEDADGMAWAHRGRIARVRIKDAGARPLTMNKTSAQVLLVEYTARLVSL